MPIEISTVGASHASAAPIAMRSGNAIIAVNARRVSAASGVGASSHAAIGLIVRRWSRKFTGDPSTV